MSEYAEGGAIAHPANEALKGIGGTVDRWAKSSWDSIRHAWRVSKEHVAQALPIAHFHWTAAWIAAAGGAAALGRLGAGLLWRRHRRNKKAQQS